MAESIKKIKESDRQEARKMAYDLFKHLTTLSTGAVVVLATFLEKLFKEPIWETLIIFTFVALLGSLMTALISMFFFMGNVQKWATEGEKRVTALIAAISLTCFLSAMISLIIFTVGNFLK